MYNTNNVKTSYYLVKCVMVSDFIFNKCSQKCQIKMKIKDKQISNLKYLKDNYH